ncbi:DEAD-domain-containing protein [Ganoderma leucocontextum]|nr:DEAD-domain-containing protein [Ganoderma leucocontextum]
MAAPLCSKALGVGLFAAARACRSSADVLALHAFRAGRLSSLRFSSTATHRQRDSLSSREHPHDTSYGSAPTGTPAETPPNPNADQPEFATLKDALHPRTLSSLTAHPFNLVHMSSVQAAVLPLLPNLVRRHDADEKDPVPRDLMVKARTGTGKTLAFLVPAVEARLNALEAHAKQVEQDTMNNSTSMIARAVEQYAKTHVGALIISPTRELATQIVNEALKLTRHHDHFEVKLFTGGLPRDRQKRSWNMGRRDIVVATPGRLRDFIENEPGFSDALRTTEMFILDEADTLLEMGFIPDITAIAQHLKPSPERQTFMFSATMSKEIRKVARESLSEKHTFVNCVPDDAAPTHHAIPQYYTTVPSADEQLPHVLRLIAEDQLANPGKSKVLIFLPTTRMVQLYSTLITQIAPSVLPAGRRTRFLEMHAKKTMDRRMRTSDWFRVDKSGAMVMLTSDVSARGVDYPGVTRVIQIGVPTSGDIYVHRVGRTGRGSNMKGRADLVLLPHEAGFLQTELSGVPIRELTTEQLQTQLDELAEKYEGSPLEFFPQLAKRTSRMREGGPPLAGGFPEGVRGRLGDVEGSVKGIQGDLSLEDVSDAMMTVLAFYGANADCCRNNKAATIAGVQAWAAALAGQSVPVRVPREWKDSSPIRRGGSRGGFQQKRFGVKEGRDFGDFKRRDSGDFKRRDFGDFQRRDSGDFQRRDSGDFQRREPGEFKRRDSGEFKRHDSRSYDRNSDGSDGKRERRPWEGRGSRGSWSARPSRDD